MNSIIYLKILQ